VRGDGQSAWTEAQKNRYDLVLTDVLLPKMNGIDLCKKVKASEPLYPVIMLTALGTTDDKVDGLDAGADDYMVKPFEMRELLARIRTVLRRANQHPSERQLAVADLQMDLDQKTVTRGGTVIDLTPKEFNLLAYMMENKGRVLSKNEIAEKVWNTDFDTGTNFIDVYISYLRRKVDKAFDDKLILTKPGMGFMLKDENTK
jgi:DNA-binding response OmpR family regulator